MTILPSGVLGEWLFIKQSSLKLQWEIKDRCHLDGLVCGARDKEAAAKVRFLEKIIRNGVPYSWLLKEINESCDGILAPGK